MVKYSFLTASVHKPGLKVNDLLGDGTEVRVRAMGESSNGQQLALKLSTQPWAPTPLPLGDA